jgi:hypothetical protein
MINGDRVIAMQGIGLPEHTTLKLSARLARPALRWGKIVVGVACLFASQSGIAQSNVAHPATPRRALANAGHVGSVVLHTDDSQGEVHGTQLDQVLTVTVAGVQFLPTALYVPKGPNATEELIVTEQTTMRLKLGAVLGVDVAFKDGRVSHYDVTVGPPRPEVELVSKTVEGAPNTGIQLANTEDLPQGATLVFSMRMLKTTNAGDVRLQVAKEDDSLSTELTEKDGTLSGGLTGRLNPAKAFGPTAFGLLKFRVLEGQSASDWVPLATLVRLPRLTSISCPADPGQQCTLAGSSLFLLDSVGAEASYIQSVTVPPGFKGSSLQVPYPTENGMVVKLRDDPSQPNPVTLHVNVAGPAPRTTP